MITPILSRVYTPEDYGEWGIFASIYLIVNYVLFLSYDNAIIRTSKEQEIPNLICLCLIIAMVMILLLSIIFKFGSLLGIDFFISYPRFDLLIILLSTATVLNLATTLANRFEFFGAMSISNVINGCLQASFRILFGLTTIIGSGLILGTVLAQMCATIVLILMMLTLLKNIDYTKISISEIKRLAIENKKFPLYDAPSCLLNFSTGQLAVIILAFYFSQAEIGCFSMIVQFVLLPVSFVGVAISKVYYRKISALSDNIAEISHITLQVSKITVSLCMLPTLFLICGGDKFLIWFLGDQWMTAGNMALCLSIVSIPIILTEALLPIYKTLNLQNVRFQMDLVSFILSLGGLFVMCIFSKNVLYSIMIYSLMFGTIRFIMFLNILYVAKIKIVDISRYFFIAILLCYIGIFVRIYFNLVG